MDSMANLRASAGTVRACLMQLAIVEKLLSGQRILLALLAVLVAGALAPTPAAAFRIPIGIPNIPIPVIVMPAPHMMYVPRGAYRGGGGYHHASVPRHRSHDDDDDNKASSGIIKDDVAKSSDKAKAGADTTGIDKPALDKPANGASAVSSAPVNSDGNTAVNSSPLGKPAAAVAAADAGRPVNVDALDEHGPDLTPER
jgi:hypothetical protein